MTLAKLKIAYEVGAKGNFDDSQAIVVLFNPSQLAYTRSATWNRVDSAVVSKEAPGGVVLFGTTAPETLTLSLFFDTYAAGSASAAPAPPDDVAGITGKVMKLAQIDTELHRPPVCRLSWGKLSVFYGVLQQASRTYTLFLEDGTPVRATMECTFMEYPGAPTASGELHSADVDKTYVVRPGDTLMGIAAALYGDVGTWRVIAEANDIEDPRALSPGRTLTIPRIG